MDAKLVLNQLNTVCEMYEEDAINSLYRNIFGVLNLDDTIETRYNMIKQYEIEGKTGYDCGWVRVEFYNDEFQTQLDELINNSGDLALYENINPATNYTTGQLGIELTLPNYPLNVQSTALKSFVQSFIMNKAQRLSTDLAKINYSIGVELD